MSPFLATLFGIIGISYLKNVGTNADMAGRRPTPPLPKVSGIGLSTDHYGFAVRFSISSRSAFSCASISGPKSAASNTLRISISDS
jgi:hypothetical protein